MVVSKYRMITEFQTIGIDIHFLIGILIIIIGVLTWDYMDN